MKNLAKKINFSKVERGDVLSIYYLIRARGYAFTGICISVKKPKLTNKNSFIIMRRVINRIAIEVSSPLFTINMMKILLEANQSKQYKTSKLLYFRKKANRKSLLTYLA